VYLKIRLALIFIKCILKILCIFIFIRVQIFF